MHNLKRGILSSYIIIILIQIGFMGFLMMQDIMDDCAVGISNHYVDKKGHGNFISIQDAIDNASSGDTIYVWAGIYYENIIINKTITLLGNGTGNTTIDGKQNGDVVNITADQVNITGFTITNSTSEWSPYSDTHAGIVLNDVEHVHVYNVHCSNNYYGLIMNNSKNNTIVNNSIKLNWEGIVSSQSDNNIIRNNTVNMNWADIGLGYSDFNSIINNYVSVIYSLHSNFNYIANNTINQTTGWGGIELWQTNSTKVKNNTMISCGLEITGDQISYWNSHSIDTNNTINGKPLYYWKDINGGTLPLGAGQIILVNCTNILVENQTIYNGNIGIQIGFSSKNVLKNNNLNNHSESGISLFQSNLNTIINNNCLNNYQGIFTEETNSNSFINNTCNLNHDGFYIKNSKLNTFIKNICSSNKRSGIYFTNSKSNIITNNTFHFNNDSSIFNLYSDSNYFSWNTCSYSENGIYMVGSHLNTFTNNNYSTNNKGIFIENGNSFTTQNTIEKNNISNNWIGIYLKSNSKGNLIIKNIIINNSDTGLFIEDDSNNNNIIYHNQFIFNKKQAISKGNNYWNNSFREGNYWSDYFGLDNGYGGRVEGNGIGDNDIPHLGLDYYPFIRPNGWIINNRIEENESGNDENSSKNNNDNNLKDSDNIILRITFFIILMIILLISIIIRRKKILRN